MPFSLSITYPWVFLGVIPLSIALYYYVQTHSIGYIAPNTLLRSYLRPSRLYILSCFLIFCIGCLGLLIFSGPTLSLTRETLDTTKREIIIVLDVSKSMLAEDLTPTRLDKAKEILDTFISRFDHDDIALVIFAGKPFVMSPLTSDYAGLRYILSYITPETIKQNIPGLSGTAIGDAILVANSLFTHTENGSIILLTDGTYNAGIDPAIASEETRSLGIRLFSIGIGSTEDTYLYTTSKNGEKNYFLDTDGKKITVNLDESFLRGIVDKTGGAYYRADSGEKFSDIFTELLSVTKSPTLYHPTTKAYDLSPFIALAILLISFTEGYVIRYYRAKYNLI